MFLACEREQTVNRTLSMGSNKLGNDTQTSRWFYCLQWYDVV